MDIANLTGGLVVGTGDLSELALGWATYSGDQMSMYGVNASVPKTLVKHLIRYEAEHTDSTLKGILYDILDTPISPELLPPEEGKIAQKTEELVGPYTLHDFFLYYMVRCGFPPSRFTGWQSLLLRAITTAKQSKVAYRVYKEVFSQQFKRSCMPDSVKIGSVSLSPRSDWRMPSDAIAGVWLKEAEEL